MANLDDPAPLARIRIQDPDNPWLPRAARGVGMGPDPECRRCDLWRTATTVCMPAQGTRGAPLIVLSSPTQADDAAGKFVTAGANAVLLHAVRRHAKEFRVVWAVGCPSGRDPTSAQVDACRPYVAAELAAGPSRALLMGPVAAESVLGVPWWPERTRRAWCWVGRVPCFLVLHPQRAARNNHYRRWLDEDVEWALTTPIQEPPDGDVQVMLTPEEATAWLDSVEDGRLLAMDTEYHPKNKWAKGEFQVLCASFAQDPGRPVVVPGQVLAQVVPALRRVVESRRIPKVLQDAKNDRHVLWRSFGVDLAGVDWDTLKVAGLVESEAPKGLGRQSGLVGMLGYKEAGQVGADDEDDE